MTNARSQQVGKWAIILGSLVVLAAVAFAVRSNMPQNSSPHADSTGAATPSPTR
ncbi:MAG: hypothetical protein U0992_14110 [Planctomycetaceae bacterium]